MLWSMKVLMIKQPIFIKCPKLNTGLLLENVDNAVVCDVLKKLQNISLWMSFYFYLVTYFFYQALQLSTN